MAESAGSHLSPPPDILGDEEEQETGEDEDQGDNGDTAADLAMQRMMGFSSFNTSQRPPRKQQKREHQSSNNIGGIGTGANSQPLASSRVIGNTNNNNNNNNNNNTSSSSTGTVPLILPTSLPPRPLPPQSHKTHQPPIAEENSTELNQTQVDMTSSAAGNQNTFYNPISTTTTTTTTTIPDSLVSAVKPTLQKPFLTNYRSQSPNPNSNPNQNQNQNQAAYTNPKTGISFTSAELKALEQGVVRKEMDAKGQEQDVVVYFRPSFLATTEELWGRLR